MIVHAVPDTINAREYGAGNWKAVEASRISIADGGAQAQQVDFDAADPTTVLAHVNEATRHLFIEYSFWPALQIGARSKYPHLGVHVRTHNAEGFHYVHRHTRRRRDYASAAMWTQFARIVARD